MMIQSLGSLSPIRQIRVEVLVLGFDLIFQNINNQANKYLKEGNKKNLSVYSESYFDCCFYYLSLYLKLFQDKKLYHSMLLGYQDVQLLSKFTFKPPNIGGYFQKLVGNRIAR